MLLGEVERDSQFRGDPAAPGRELVPLLAENFSRVVFVSSRRLDPALIERERPDIVIEEFVERSLNAPGALPMILAETK